MKSIIKYSFFLLSSIVFAQLKTDYINYSWDEKSIENFDVSKHQNEEMVAVKEKQIHDFVIVNRSNFIEYQLTHNIFWVNSNDKIEQFNKVYLPIFSDSQLALSKARVITASKKIIKLDASKILESKDEETQVTYKYFALEGVEKGAFIEYFYVTKNNPKYTGARVALQADYKKYNVDFEVIAPKNLEFAFKSYNDLPEVKKDTTVKGNNHWKLHINKIEGLQPQEKAPYATLLQQLVYKLDRNVDNPDFRFFDYEQFAQRSYQNTYRDIDKETAKAISTFLKSLEIKKLKSNSEKLRAIETEIKTSFYVTPQSAEESETLITILDKKISSEFGIIKLYASLLQYLEIENQLVVTCNRISQKFDPKFEAYNFMNQYLFFLPKENKYLDPLDVSSRLGYPNGYFTDNYGLFIEPINKDLNAVKTSIKYIEAVDYKKSTDSMFVDIKIDNKDITKTQINFKQSYTGYKALYLQPFIHLYPSESKGDVLENFLNQYYPDVTVKSANFKNDEKNDFGNAPLLLNATMETTNYISKAGRKHLFKIGELIGPQIEMYQDKARTQPTEDRNTKLYFRKLVFEIPEGYVVKNLKSLVLDQSHSNNKGEIVFLFQSNYTLKGNILSVIIDEYYNQNIIPVNEYEIYRTVINSAADFNKATLILEKE